MTKNKVVGFAVFFVLFFLPSNDIYAQWTFMKTYGGKSITGYAAIHDSRAVRQTPDGGFVVAGSCINSFSATTHSDVWLIKLDPKGNIEWEKIYGVNGYVVDGIDPDDGLDLTSDGGFIIGGYVIPKFKEEHFFALKLDSAGNTQWHKTYTVTSYGDPVSRAYAYAVKQTPDGGFVIYGMQMGNYYPGALLLKLDPSGNIEWFRRYAVSEKSPGTGRNIAIHPEGGFVAAGFGGGGFWVLRLDDFGNILWERAYRGPEANGYKVVVTSDGGFIMVGEIWHGFDSSSSYDGFVVKLDGDGNILWQKIYGGSEYDGFVSIVQTQDGGFGVVGLTSSFSKPRASGNFWYLKLDANGDIQWEKEFGFVVDEGPAIYHLLGYSIDETSDGGFIMAGHVNVEGLGYAPYIVVKVNEQGEIGPSCSLIKSTNATVKDANMVVGYPESDTSSPGMGWIVTDWNYSVDTNAEITTFCEGHMCPPAGCVPDGSTHPTDMNCNNCVDELIEFSYSFGSKCGDDWHISDADFDDNGYVDGTDLSIFVNDFGAGCF